MESAWLYREVAAAEPDSIKSRLFLKLATAAEEQATRWAAIAVECGDTLSCRSFAPAPRARIVARLVRMFGPRSMRSVLAAMKLRGLSMYSAPSLAGPASAQGHRMPTSLAEVGARHRSSLGGSLRAAVFGVNDGLVSNASLVLGIAGAGITGTSVLMTGAAGLLAGALSMAAGEYVSVRTQREMFEYQIALERAEVAEYPEEEAEELALIYNARGLDLDQAREMSRALLQSPAHALDVLAREELGLNPDDLGSPVQAATASFIAFATGSAIPLLPFLGGMPAHRLLPATVTITALALFGAGLASSLFTGRHALRGGLRMVLIGGGAGAVSFLVGKLLGGALAL